MTYVQWLKEQEGRDDATGWYARFWKEVTPGRISSPAGIEKHLNSLTEGENALTGDDLSHAKYAIGHHRQAVAEYHAYMEGTLPDPPPRAPLASVTPLPVAGQEIAAEMTQPQQPDAQPQVTYPFGYEGQPGVLSVPFQHAEPPTTAQQQEAAQKYIQDKYAGDAASWATSGLAQRFPGGRLGPGEAEKNAVLKAGKYTGWPQERFDRLELKVDLLIELLNIALGNAIMRKAGQPDPIELLRAVVGIPSGPGLVRLAQGELAAPETVMDRLTDDQWTELVRQHPQAGASAPWASLWDLAAHDLTEQELA